MTGVLERFDFRIDWRPMNRCRERSGRFDTIDLHNVIIQIYPHVYNVVCYLRESYKFKYIYFLIRF